MLGLALSFAAVPAVAAEPTPTELAVARRLFNEATALESEQRWHDAALKLREAIRIKDTPGLRFHLAHCQQNLGLLVEALLDYDRARDLIAAGAHAADVETLLPAAQRALSRRVPSLVIVSPSGMKEVTATIDGRTVAPSVLGRPAPVNPGKHRVTVSAPGYERFVAEVTVSEGERRVLSVSLREKSRPHEERATPHAVKQAARPEPELASTQLSTRTYVLVGEVAATAAFLAVGVTFMVAGSRADDRVVRADDRVVRVAMQSNVSPRCDTATGDVLEACRDLTEAYNDRNRYELLSTAGFVGAGIGAVATLATYLFWDDTPPPLSVSGSAQRDSFWLGAAATF